MLKTNSKKAKENINGFIVENFTPGNEMLHNLELPNLCKVILTHFRSEVYSCDEDFKYFKNSEFEAFRYWCSGLPSVFNCDFYLGKAKNYIAEILEETENEKNKYSENEAVKLLEKLLYCELKKGEADFKKWLQNRNAEFIANVNLK